MRRPWHVALAALAAGLALAASPEAAPPAAAAAALALTALRAPGLGAIAAVLLLAGSVGGQLRLAAIDAPAGRVRDGERVSVRAELTTAPRPGRFGSSAEARVASGRLRGARLLLRFPAWRAPPRSLGPGAEAIVAGRLSSPADRGSPEHAAHLRRRGIAAELLVERAAATGRRRGGLAGALDRMRTRAERAVAAGMPAPEAALLRGMVLGQDEAIDEAARTDFRASGLAHLLAVSGQNVMLLAALALPLLLLSGVGPRGGLAVVCALIAVYVPLAGAGPSLQRAGLMGLAGLVAMAASRPASRWYALLLAAAGTLAWNPRSAGEPGWQLSFAAVVGILVLGVPMGRWLAHAAVELIGGGGPAARTRAAARILAEGVAMTVAATLATAPLLAHHFGSVPLAGLPANVLALPAVAPAMWLGMMKIALGQLGALPGAPGELALAAADALGPPAAAAVGFIGLLAERFADAPGGQVSLRLGSAPAVLAAYAAMAAAWFAIRRAAGPPAARLDEAAARWRRLPRARRAAIAALLVLVASGAAAEGLSRPDPPDRLTVSFLNVGQGDATLIQHPDGTAVLFDGGPPEAGVARLLRRAGVRRLALVVATHASRDHHGGLAEVLERFPVGALLDGGDGTRDREFGAVIEATARRGVRRIPAVAPLVVRLGGLTVTVLSPPPRPGGPAPEDPNPRGVVALVGSGGFDLLLSADAESDALLPLALPDVDAMKVPHHGSADPGLPEALERLRPEVAAIEVGPNTYGHPTRSTLSALRRARARTYRTDRSGTVTLTVEGGGMTVSTER